MNKNEKALKSNRLALFFTLGVSLRFWEKIGQLSRESRIYKYLADHFDEVYFLTYGSEDKAYERKIAPIKVLPKSVIIPIMLYSVLMPLIHWKVLKKIDILKTNQMLGAWAAVFTKLLMRKKLIVRCGYEWKFFHERKGTKGIKLKLIYLIENFVYRFADAVILTSEEMKHYVCSTFGIRKEKVYVIPNYIDTELFKPMPEVKKIPNRLIFVGRFVKQKNLMSLLEAVKDLPEIELVLVGDGPLAQDLKKYSILHRINIDFKGHAPNEKLPVLLNTAEVFILPSLYEGNPKALLEAMACGLPVIGADVDGIRDVIKHRKNGILCGTDPKSIKRAIKILMNNEELKKKLGLAARKTIETEFSFHRLIEKEIALCRKLLSNANQI